MVDPEFDPGPEWFRSSDPDSGKNLIDIHNVLLLSFFYTQSYPWKPTHAFDSQENP